MKLPIKLLIFASSGLFSYNSSASLFETTNNPTHKSEDLKTTPSISNNAFSSQYITNFFSGSESASIALQLPTSKQTDWFYNKLKQLHESDVELAESSASQKAEIHNDDIPFLTVPLPAAVWLFLGGLLGFLRIQRKSK